MNIYFACSITGGRQFEAVYQAIARALLEDGHKVPTAHLADAGVKALEAVAVVRTSAGLRSTRRRPFFSETKTVSGRGGL